VIREGEEGLREPFDSYMNEFFNTGRRSCYTVHCLLYLLSAVGWHVFEKGIERVVDRRKRNLHASFLPHGRTTPLFLKSSPLFISNILTQENRKYFKYLY
jgi:hypothetical protein